GREGREVEIVHGRIVVEPRGEPQGIDLSPSAVTPDRVSGPEELLHAPPGGRGDRHFPGTVVPRARSRGKSVAGRRTLTAVGMEGLEDLPDGPAVRIAPGGAVVFRFLCVVGVGVEKEGVPFAHLPERDSVAIVPETESGGGLAVSLLPDDRLRTE